MVRKHTYSAGAARVSTLVTDRMLTEARERAQAAAERVTEAEHADPSRRSWAAEYEAATAAARAADRQGGGLGAAAGGSDRARRGA
jgi:hypothetical protein